MLHEQPEDAEYRQAEQVDRPFTADRPKDLLFQYVRIGRFGMTAQVLLPVAEADQADDHADTGGAETVSPAEGLAEPAAQQRGGERTDVDPHVEDREARVAARVVLRVELADDGRDIRLQVTDAHDDKRQCQVEHAESGRVPERNGLRQQGAGGEHLAARQSQALGQGKPGRVGDGLVTLDGHQYVAERQQCAAEEDRFAHAEITVRDESADHGQRVYEAGIGAEDVEAHLDAKHVLLGQVQEQQEFHPVE